MGTLYRIDFGAGRLVEASPEEVAAMLRPPSAPEPHGLASEACLSAKRSDAAKKAAATRSARAEAPAPVASVETFAHGYAVGDVLVSSWGYDQTNVDFYKVTRVTRGTVDLVEIGCEEVKEKGGRGCEYVIPQPDVVIGQPSTRRPGRHGVKINGYRHASKWSGTPQYRTASGWGH